MCPATECPVEMPALCWPGRRHVPGVPMPNLPMDHVLWPHHGVRDVPVARGPGQCPVPGRVHVKLATAVMTCQSIRPRRGAHGPRPPTHRSRKK